MLNFYLIITRNVLLSLSLDCVKTVTCVLRVYLDRYHYIFFICIFTFFFHAILSRVVRSYISADSDSIIMLLRVFDNILCSFMWMIITIAIQAEKVIVTVTVTVAVWSLTFRFGSTTSRVYTTSCLLHNYDFTIGIFFLSRSTFHWTTNSSISKVGCVSFCD